MKKNLLVLILLISNHTISYCPKYIVTSYPETGSMIERNQLLVLYLTNLPFIDHLSWSKDGRTHSDDSSKVRFYFVSKKHTVPATILKRIKGDSRHNQFIIKPSIPLHFSQKYLLKIKIYNRKKEIFEIFSYNSDVFWNVSNKTNHVSTIKMSGFPVFLENSYMEFGCGEVRTSDFKISSPEGTIVISELIDKKTNEEKHSIEIIQNDKVSIGTLMCGGAYEFKRKHPYKIRFKPFNPDQETAWGDFISFKSP